MKNKIFTIFLIITASAAFAQVPRGFSVAAGANVSNWNSKDLLADGGIGYTFGLGFNFGYHESYNFECDLLLSENALDIYAIDNSNTNVSQVKATFQTVSFSAQFNYYVIKPDEDKFYVGAFAGVNAGFGNGAIEIKESTNGITLLPYKLDTNSLTYVPKVTASPILGVVAGYNKFRLALRYDIGVTNILKDVQTPQIDGNGRYTGPALEGKLSTASAILYYKFF